MYLFDRIDQAQLRAGAKLKLGRLPQDFRLLLAKHADSDARKTMELLQAPHKLDRTDKTVVIEFARGGPEAAPMPLDPPHGYLSALPRLSPQILDGAHILYVKVRPEESRRKNFTRAIPPPGVEDTGIYHGTPTSVMRGDYGCCDMPLLLKENDGHPQAVRIHAHGQEYILPTAVFDNQDDMTTYLREPADEWDPARVKVTLEHLQKAMAPLL